MTHAELADTTATLRSLDALSPLDGRYADQLQTLGMYFSEAALIRYRYRIEVRYLIALAREQVGPMHEATSDVVDALTVLERAGLTDQDLLSIKAHERRTRHDVKALEYHMREILEARGLGDHVEAIHFGLTSQDVNHTAYPLLVQSYLQAQLLPGLIALVRTLRVVARQWSDHAMLARTHGQPASPTRLGKEMLVFAERLNGQVASLIQQLPLTAKFGGATGNFNAHVIAYPHVDWLGFGDRFCQSLGLGRQQFTTQIEHYDGLAAILHTAARASTILLDLCRDVWQYISMGYFRQRPVPGEVGSSAMPHKINPIDFEFAEGNLGLARALMTHLADKLPVSRLQRDLSDSTVLRHVGVPFAHLELALQGINKGMAKLWVDEGTLGRDLAHHALVLAEAYQTILRREGVEAGYDLIKNITRTGETLTLEDLHRALYELELPAPLTDELLSLRPETYLGVNPDPDSIDWIEQVPILSPPPTRQSHLS